MAKAPAKKKSLARRLLHREPKKKYLSADDLKQFRYKRSAVEQVTIMQKMIAESFKQWAEELKKQYRIKGDFLVNPADGEITLVEKDADG